MKTFSILIIAFLTLGCQGKENDKPVNITVDPAETAELSDKASTFKLSITANVQWEVSSSETWCKTSLSGGLKGTTELTVTVDENKNSDSRASVLTFKSGSYKKEYTVSQNMHIAEPEIISPTGYTLVWHDEFNDARNSGKAVLPNASEWWYETGNGGWGNNEIENYISAYRGTDTCARIYSGTLKITAKKVGTEVLSTRMNTSKNWTYGYFEARLKLPSGKGTWPAFWMMPKNFTAWPDDGEIDIMEEVGFRPNWVSSSIHCKAYYHSIGTQKTAETFVSTAESAFHVYAVEWTADFIKGYVDGVKYFEFLNDHTNNYNTWPFYKPFYLKLNLAWGGNWGGAQGVDITALPATYEIDYVRVFQK